MARGQENGTTILLGLKGYEVGKVVEEEKGILIAPLVAQRSYIAMVRAEGGYFTVGAMAGRFTLSYIAAAGDAGNVIALLMMEQSSRGLTPG